MKFGFKKYEYENIRTEYQPINNSVKKPTDGATSNPKDVSAEAGQILVSTSTKTTVHSGTTLPTAGEGETLYYLAEDFNIGDQGFVYYIIDDVNNLEVR